MLRMLLMIIVLLAAPVFGEQQQQAAALVGVTWRLARYGDVSSPRSVPTEGYRHVARLRFGVSPTRGPLPPGEDGLSVFDGCNHVLGLPTASAEIRPIVTFAKGWGTTLMDCPDEHLIQTTSVTGVLERSERFVVDKRTLTIFYDRGRNALVFEATTP